MADPITGILLPLGITELIGGISTVASPIIAGIGSFASSALTWIGASSLIDTVTGWFKGKEKEPQMDIPEIPDIDINKVHKSPFVGGSGYKDGHNPFTKGILKDIKIMK